MPVRTSESHGGDAVDKRDFYRRRIEANPSNSENARAMIQLIDRLDAGFPTTDVWLLTSHHHLILMDAPTYDGGDWLVTIQGCFSGDYWMSYLIPAHQSPFPRPSEVHTTAQGIDQAVEFIKIAMRESGGWKDSPELWA